MIERILAVVALLFVGSVALAPVASADNCDIFINPEDCQNTGWTVGTIATVTGGVAVATVAVLTAQGSRTSTPPPVVPLPPPPGAPPPRPPNVGRPPRDRREDDDSIEGVETRPVIDAPVVTVHPEGVPDRVHTLRLELGRDPGTQTIQEGHDGPR